jgi:phosphomannomutase / phosphoglucomutase
MTDPWKPCDIRGVFPNQVSPTLFRLVGTSVGSMLPAGSRVLIAGDFRASTPVLKDALAEGMLAAGAHVLDLGQVATPIAFFAHRHYNTAAVLVVTGSHNPQNNNGLKLMIGTLPPSPGDIEELRQRVEQGPHRQAQGVLETIDPVPAYRDCILKRWRKVRGAMGMPVVLDAGNGAWSELAPSIFESLGFKVHRLFCEIDGEFSNRSPDCARPGNLSALSQEVQRTKAALGIAWDGDGDRVAFVDETASIVSADEIAIFLIRALVPGQAGARVVYDIKMSGVVRQSIVECGGTPLVERSGHAFVERKMIQENCLLGCEASGHYFFRELDGRDDGLFTALLMAELVNRSGPLARLRKSLPPFFATPDLRFPAEMLTYGEVVKRLRSHLTTIKESTVDGLRVQTPDGIVLVRESVTEPVVTMRLEGCSAQSLSRLMEICRKALPEVSDEILEQIRQLRGS